MSTRVEAERIRSMFSEIASRYDRANTILSAGIHHLWRRKLVRMSGARAGQKVLDCATGTGDLAIEFKKSVGSIGKVIGTDFCAEMLSYAPEKARQKALQIRFETADVTALPYETASFDIASISFGIRNVENPQKALTELARVVKAGGTVMILEFGQPRAKWFRALFEFYSRAILPKIGGLITGRSAAYEYLQNSSANFPCAENFLQMMRETRAFTACDYQPVSFGIAYIYRGIVKTR